MVYTEIMFRKDKSLIIFDCDGVLRSSSWNGLFNAYVSIIQNIGRDHKDFFRDLAEFKKWWNPDWKENNKTLGIIDDETNNKIFYGCYEPYVALFPWTMDTLKRLSRKYTLAMLTNGSSKSAKNSLGETAEYFTLIAGCEHVGKLKPDPEGINFILKNLNFLPSQAIMIGDMAVDVLAGKNASIKTGAVNWGLGDWKDLLKLKPDYKFKRPEDLLHI